LRSRVRGPLLRVVPGPAHPVLIRRRPRGRVVLRSLL